MKDTSGSSLYPSKDVENLTKNNRLQGDVEVVDQREGICLRGYLQPVKAQSISVKPFGAYDFETYSLSDGRQRVYLLIVHNPALNVHFKTFRRCDYLIECDYNTAIGDSFLNHPCIYFSFNGSNFDHILLHRILVEYSEHKKRMFPKPPVRTYGPWSAGLGSDLSFLHTKGIIPPRIRV